ncbi:uncharacterized protein E6C27_scaffold43059G00810 [Cucumis melo var. makuwa]|uniref:Uncharacterized protein n=1 Tax=Cucumis melo var. makuwa TaxID=1194695 RepID=A0A5A7SRR9_CUCMM|nr:uncharacterized protein E6C27_scaffold43059G00810 [Cucumis melo var. makuwa]
MILHVDVLLATHILRQQGLVLVWQGLELCGFPFYEHEDPTHMLCIGMLWGFVFGDPSEFLCISGLVLLIMVTSTLKLGLWFRLWFSQTKHSSSSKDQIFPFYSLTFARSVSNLSKDFHFCLALKDMGGPRLSLYERLALKKAPRNAVETSEGPSTSHQLHSGSTTQGVEQSTGIRAFVLLEQELGQSRPEGEIGFNDGPSEAITQALYKLHNIFIQASVSTMGLVNLINFLQQNYVPKTELAQLQASSAHIFNY